MALERERRATILFSSILKLRNPIKLWGPKFVCVRARQTRHRNENFEPIWLLNSNFAAAKFAGSKLEFRRRRREKEARKFWLLLFSSILFEPETSFSLISSIQSSNSAFCGQENSRSND